jgi:hypothetical protein
MPALARSVSDYADKVNPGEAARAEIADAINGGYAVQAV